MVSLGRASAAHGQGRMLLAASHPGMHEPNQFFRTQICDGDETVSELLPDARTNGAVRSINTGYLQNLPGVIPCPCVVEFPFSPVFQ